MNFSRICFLLVLVWVGLGVCIGRADLRDNNRGISKDDNKRSMEELRHWAKDLEIQPDWIENANMFMLIKMIKKKIDADIIEKEKDIEKGKQDYEEIKQNYDRNIKKIAKRLGVSEEKTNSYEIIVLLKIINEQLINSQKQYKEVILSEDDMRILEICLTDEQKQLDIIKKYHEFLKDIHGRTLIFIP